MEKEEDTFWPPRRPLLWLELDISLTHVEFLDFPMFCFDVIVPITNLKKEDLVDL